MGGGTKATGRTGFAKGGSLVQRADMELAFDEARGQINRRFSELERNSEAQRSLLQEAFTDSTAAYADHMRAVIEQVEALRARVDELESRWWEGAWRRLRRIFTRG